jgi:hypothetical protein
MLPNSRYPSVLSTSLQTFGRIVDTLANAQGHLTQSSYVADAPILDH